jgi:putative addiction module component (TIGR02574 family)
MKAALQPIEHLGKFERLQLVEDLWDDFAGDPGPKTRPEVVDELARRAAWRDSHPSQGKSLLQIAQLLGVNLGIGLYLPLGI